MVLSNPKFFFANYPKLKVLEEAFLVFGRNVSFANSMFYLTMISSFEGYMYAETSSGACPILKNDLDTEGVKVHYRCEKTHCDKKLKTSSKTLLNQLNLL